MFVIQVSREEWLRDFATNAHLCVFADGFPDPDTLMFEYVLLVIDKATDQPVAYQLIKEITKIGKFIEYGGVFPQFRGTNVAKEAFTLLLAEMKKLNTKLVILLTMNTNVKMQRLALSMGFLCYGVSMGRFGLCLEYRLNLEEKKEGNNDTL